MVTVSSASSKAPSGTGGTSISNALALSKMPWLIPGRAGGKAEEAGGEGGAEAVRGGKVEEAGGEGGAEAVRGRGPRVDGCAGHGGRSHGCRHHALLAGRTRTEAPPS